MSKIAFNTMKIAAAAIISIFIATALHLEYAVSAGIVAILTIQPTKKETLKTAFGRFIAFLSALIIAGICFTLFDYTLVGFSIYLIVFIGVCQIFHWYSAMAMNSVLISHLLSIGNMSIQAVYNETMIFVIGVGMGIIVNLHLRKNVDYIEELKESTDNQIRKILQRMSERILDKDVSDYNGDCFIALKHSIQQAKNVAEENFNNQFGFHDTYDKEYIRMRERQCQILYEMYKRVRTIETTPITAEKISVFLSEMASVYHKNNTGKELLKQFHVLDLEMKSHPLPTERKEFEDRAQLYTLLRSIEEFLQIKAEFAKEVLSSYDRKNC